MLLKEYKMFYDKILLGYLIVNLRFTLHKDDKV